MQQVAQVEREREDYKTQLSAAKKQLEEAAHQQNRIENKMSKLQQMLRSANEDKANLEAKLVQKQMTLSSVEEALKQKTDDMNILKDKYKNLESQFGHVSEQRSQSEVKYEFHNTYYLLQVITLVIYLIQIHFIFVPFFTYF